VERPRRDREAPPGESAEDQTCPACGSMEFHTLFSATDRLYETTEKEFEIIECKRCRLIRLFPQPSPSELTHYYPEDYWYAPAAESDRLEEMYRRFVLRDHLNFVTRAIEKSGETGVVLDVGCGGGLFLKMLMERGLRVVGLDFSLDAAALAWQVNRAPAVCSTLSRAPFPPNSCAVITMFHVLEHLYDPSSYLESARDLLRPEGRLIVQVPNAACWEFLLLGENWSGIDVPRHLLNFRANDLEILMDRSGFEIVRQKHFSLRDNPAGFATSLAPSLDPMARRIRKIRETPRKKLLKDLVYLGLVACCLPFTLLEAACHAGSTIMVEARKKE
jgi:2-polyprenyl-3-methyl-5-hydroxy-6-metoxy-1,4-benzoquinol methylase